jgi:hypothetical protein
MCVSRSAVIEERSRLHYYPGMRTSARPIRLLVLFAFVVPLLGCLDTDTRVSLGEDGSGSIALVYTIDRAAWDTGVFDDGDVARPVPVTRTEFESAALSIDGLRLRSHRVRGDDERVTVTARLDFDSVDSLRRLLGAQSLEVTVDDEGGAWRQVVAPGGGSADEEARLLAAELAGYTMAFELETPAQVIATNGETTGRTTASFSVDLGSVATAVEPIVWEVRW